MRALARRVWPRGAAGDRAVASVDTLISRAEGISRATGQSADEAAAVVVHDLEQAANALTT